MALIFAEIIRILEVIVGDRVWNIGRMITRGKSMDSRKTCLTATFPPQIQHGLTFMVKSRQLTAWATKKLIFYHDSGVINLTSAYSEM
jgi:hypothetical protein